jgi:hypothetical protein
MFGENRLSDHCFYYNCFSLNALQEGYVVENVTTGGFSMRGIDSRIFKARKKFPDSGITTFIAILGYAPRWDNFQWSKSKNSFKFMFSMSKKDKFLQKFRKTRNLDPL